MKPIDPRRALITLAGLAMILTIPALPAAGSSANRARTAAAQTRSLSGSDASRALFGLDGASRARLADGRVLVTGGTLGQAPQSRAEILSADGVVMAARPMTIARSGHASVVLADGRVLVTGGETPDGISGSAEVFDPATGAWSELATMSEARSGHTMTLLRDGRVLIAGGSGSEVFDPVQGGYAFAGALVPPRRGHASVLLPDGRVLITGGFDEDGAPLAVADIYDPVGQGVGPSRGQLVSARGGHTATALPDGRIVIAGGRDAYAELRSVEIYESSRDGFANATLQMRSGRSGHDARLLGDTDEVQLVGGTSNHRIVKNNETLDLSMSSGTSKTETTAAVEVTLDGGGEGTTTVSAPAPTSPSGPVSGNLDQCRNGTLAAPVQCTGSALVNGNAGGSNAHWLEGDSIMYRLRMSGLATAGTHTVTIEWDTTQSGKHAIDYLTTFNRTETTANPCSGVTGCVYTPPPPANADGLGSGTYTTVAIPVDPLVSGAGVTQVPGKFVLFNGTVTNVSAYTVSGTYAGSSSTRITLTFSASNANAVLAWSGHIATRLNWGATNSAVSISGSPFHTRLVEIDGGGGNQDRSLSNDAVIFPGSITVIKDVANGTNATDFAFTATGGLAPASFSLDDDGDNTSNPPSQLSNTQVFANILDFSTSRVITEANAGPTFALTALGCSVVGGNGGSATPSVPNRTATLNVKEGESWTCTFTNTLQAGSLRVIKNVLNNSGGTRSASEFTLHVKSGANDVANSPAAGSATGTVYALAPGSYTVSENDPTSLGYQQTGFSGDCDGSGSVTVVSGQEKTCTITNDDVGAHLIVIKHMVNDNGGSATSSNFTMSVTAAGASPASFAGAESPGTNVALNAGAYSVGESGPSGYSASYSADCNGTIALGETKTCTVTNNDVAPQLIVIKHVVNDNGGTAVAGDFTMSVTAIGPSPSSFPGAEAPGTTVTLNAGSYSVGESGPSGYAASYSADCTGSIVVGQTKTCTVTNNDVAPQLIVIKHVVNNSGGTAAAGDFTLSVTGSSPSPASFPGVEAPGTTVTLGAGGYSVGESGPAGYTASYSTDCTGSIAVGQTKTCTVTNDDDKATPGLGTTMSWVLHDSATLTGFRPGAPDAAGATIIFKLYGPSLAIDCSAGLLIDTRTVTGITGAGPWAVPTGIAVSAPGTYRWVAVYSGDTYNASSTSPCGAETHTIIVGEP